MVWIDAHCHPLLSDADSRQNKLDSWQNNWLLACSTSIEEFQELELEAKSHPQIIPCIGWHPWNINTIGVIAEQTRYPIGEIGLDFHPRWRKTEEVQVQVFEQICKMAIDLNLPVIVHSVKAHHVILRILKKFQNLRMYLHGFTGNLELVEQYNSYDILFGCSIVHFPQRWNRIYKDISPEKILLESDALVHLSTFAESVLSCESAIRLLPQISVNFERLLEDTCANFIQFQS